MASTKNDNDNDDHTITHNTFVQKWDDAKNMAVRKHCIVPLSSNSHKGSSGRVGVLGGNARYTGAPYYAATAALQVGADLAFVFCADEAALPIKCYSPELMVVPVYSATKFDQLVASDAQEHDDGSELLIQRMVQDVVSMLDRLHVLIIGPGLGRCPLVMQATARIIKEARRRQVALVLDGDALFLLTQPEYQTLLQGYSKAILTPNVVEFHRLLKAVGEADHHIDDNNNNIDKVDNGDPMYRLEALDKTIVILKGRHDQVFRLTRDDDRDNGETPTRRRRLICAEEGGLKRSGGIGDILAGTLGVLVAWHEILQTEQDETSATTSSSNTSENTGTTDHNLEESRTDWLLQSCWTACCITKRATKRAFDVKKRAMAAPDILQEIGVTVEHMTTTSAQI